MRREHRTARRLLAAAVLIVATGALLATSPAQPPTNTLDDRAEVRATLTADRPVASVRVTVAASDEALWSDDPEIVTDTASLFVSATGAWAPLAGDPPRPPDAPSRPIVRLTVLSSETGRPLVDESPRLADDSVDLLAVCPESRDCLAEYELLVEWIDPIPGLEVGSAVEASSHIQIQGPVNLPVGATASIEVAEPVAVEVPVLNADVRAAVMIDAEHALAMWSVVLDVDEGAVPEALSWPIESRASFVATIEPVSNETGQQLEEGDVSILLIPDSRTEIEPQVAPGFAQHDFDPFEGCRSNAPCQRRLSVVVRWHGAEPGLGAEVAWRLDAGIVYHGDSAPTADAKVRAGIESETLVGDRGPVLSASAEGVVELDESDGGLSERRTLALDIPRDALAAELLGGPVPAVTGIVKVEARSATPVEGNPVFVLASFDQVEDDVDESYHFRDPQLNGGPIVIPIYPATECRADHACDSTLTLGFGLSATDLPRLEGAAITVTWSVEVRLQYPALVDPPTDAKPRLSHVAP